MPPALLSRSWLTWVGNLGLLMCGVAAIIAATKYGDLIPVINPGTGNHAGPDWTAIGAALAPGVPWALVILGWKVVSRQQDARERRKEVRGEIERLIKDVSEIELRTYNYLATSGDSTKSRRLGLRLKSDLARLGEEITRLARFENLDALEAMTELRQAITFREFDSSSRQPCDSSSEWIADVRDASHALIGRLEVTFREKHR